ncbi:MAG: MFS transporter [Actinomycetota bacterium]|nr:MFS transporter [Actinomycetota bacterium]
MQFLHAAGDAIVTVALANTLFFALPLGEARDRVGLYLALTMAPFAVLSPLVGPWLDRRPGTYRTAIVLAAAGRALLAFFLITRTAGLALYPLAFGLLVLSRVHGVSRSALVPDVLPPGKPPKWANARLSVLSVLGATAGAGVAAGATRIDGSGLALGGAVAVFSAALVPGVRLPRATAVAGPRVTGPRYRELLSSRLLAGGVAMGASRATVGFLTFLLAFLLRADGVQGRGFVGVIAAAGAGGLAGAVMAPVVRGVVREPFLLLGSLVAVVAAALWAGESFDLVRATVVAGVVGAATGAGRLAFDGLLQRDAPSSLRGRTFARYETIFQLCWVCGARPPADQRTAVAPPAPADQADVYWSAETAAA